MLNDVDPTQTPPCPECAPGAAAPHTEPSLLHVHLTPYGYLLYTPGHERPTFIEELREAAYRAGREAAARDIEAERARWDRLGYDDGGAWGAAVRLAREGRPTDAEAGEPDRGEGEWDAHDRAEHEAQLQAHRDEYGPEVEAERAGDQP